MPSTTATSPSTASLWKCEVCTLENPMSRRRCQVCETRRSVNATTTMTTMATDMDVPTDTTTSPKGNNNNNNDSNNKKKRPRTTLSTNIETINININIRIPVRVGGKRLPRKCLRTKLPPTFFCNQEAGRATKLDAETGESISSSSSRPVLVLLPQEVPPLQSQSQSQEDNDRDHYSSPAPTSIATTTGTTKNSGDGNGNGSNQKGEESSPPVALSLSLSSPSATTPEQTQERHSQEEAPLIEILPISTAAISATAAKSTDNNTTAAPESVILAVDKSKSSGIIMKGTTQQQQQQQQQQQEDASNDEDHANAVNSMDTTAAAAATASSSSRTLQGESLVVMTEQPFAEKSPTSSPSITDGHPVSLKTFTTTRSARDINNPTSHSPPPPPSTPSSSSQESSSSASFCATIRSTSMKGMTQHSQTDHHDDDDDDDDENNNTIMLDTTTTTASGVENTTTTTTTTTTTVVLLKDESSSSSSSPSTEESVATVPADSSPRMMMMDEDNQNPTSTTTSTTSPTTTTTTTTATTNVPPPPPFNDNDDDHHPTTTTTAAPPPPPSSLSPTAKSNDQTNEDAKEVSNDNSTLTTMNKDTTTGTTATTSAAAVAAATTTSTHVIHNTKNQPLQQNEESAIPSVAAAAAVADDGGPSGDVVLPWFARDHTAANAKTSSTALLLLPTTSTTTTTLNKNTTTYTNKSNPVATTTTTTTTASPTIASTTMAKTRPMTTTKTTTSLSPSSSSSSTTSTTFRYTPPSQEDEDDDQFTRKRKRPRPHRLPKKNLAETSFGTTTTTTPTATATATATATTTTTTTDRPTAALTVIRKIPPAVLAARRKRNGGPLCPKLKRRIGTAVVPRQQQQQQQQGQQQPEQQQSTLYPKTRQGASDVRAHFGRPPRSTLLSMTMMNNNSNNNNHSSNSSNNNDKATTTKRKRTMVPPPPPGTARRLTLGSSTSIRDPDENSNNGPIKSGIPLIAAAFTTAGSNRKIAVSRDSLLRANRLLQEEEQQPAETNNSSIESGTKPMAAAFTTAGSKRQIAVSKDSLLRANRLLQEEPPENSNSNGPIESGTRTMAASFTTAGSKREIAVSKASLLRANRLLQEGPSENSNNNGPIESGTKTMAAAFTTAGSNRTIAVLKDSLLRANRLLQEGPPENSKNSGSIESGTKPMAATFTTAGSKRQIAVSKDSLLRANRLLQEKPSAEKNNGPIESGTKTMAAAFTTAGSKRQIAVSKDSLLRANRLLQEEQPAEQNNGPIESGTKTMAAAFTTAGSNRQIAVSKASLLRANRLLQEGPPENNKVPIKSSTNNGPIKSDTKPMAATFTTAGSNSKISVSKDSLLRANLLIQEPRESNIGSFQPSASPVAAFTTAGSNSKISVSEESLSRANRLLQEQPESTKRSKESGAPLMAAFTTAGSNRQISVSKDILLRANRLLQDTPASNNGSVDPRADPVVGFTTAGSKRQISVSKDSLLRANRLLQEQPADSNTGPTESIAAPAAGFTTAGSNRKISVSNDSLSRATRVLQEQPASNKISTESGAPSMAAFSTAGSNRQISVSKDSLVRANRLLQERPASNNSKVEPRAAPAAGFTTAGSKRQLAVSEDSLLRANRLLHATHENNNRSFQPSPAPVAAFTTAGTNRHISVSRDSLSRANQLLQDPLESNKAPIGSATAFTTAGSKRQLTVTKDSLLRANRLLQEPRETKNGSVETSAPPVAGFTTAGSKRHLAVSKDSLSRANRLLQEHSESNNGLIHSRPAPVAAFATAGSKREITVSKDSLLRAKRLLIEAPESNNRATAYAATPVAAVATAGSNRQIVSKDSMLLAHRLPLQHPPQSSKGPTESVAGFTTAGSKRQIAVSKDSLLRANRFLQDEPESTNGPKNSGPSAIAAFTTAGSKRQISVSEDTLLRANRLLQDPPKSSKGPIESGAVPVAAFTTAGSTRQISVSEDSMSRANGLLQQPPESNNGPIESGVVPVATFTTAGSKRSISVSEDSLLRANRLLQSESNLDKKNGPLPTDDLSRGSLSCSRPAPPKSTTGSSEHHFVSTARPPPLQPVTLGNPDMERARMSPPEIMDGGVESGRSLVATFTTAGSERRIVPSEESLQRANRLLQQPRAVEKPGKENEPLPNDSYGDTHHKPISVGPPLAVGFQTAGSKRTLSVTEKGLQRAKILMQQDDEDRQQRCAKHDLVPALRCADVTKSFEYKHGDRIGNVPPLARLRSAESDRMIRALKASTEVADQLPCENIREGSTLVAERNLSLGEQIERPSLETKLGALSPSLSAMFQTAGCNTEIQISKESIERVNLLWKANNQDEAISDPRTPDIRAIPSAEPRLDYGSRSQLCLFPTTPANIELDTTRGNAPPSYTIISTPEPSIPLTNFEKNRNSQIYAFQNKSRERSEAKTRIHDEIANAGPEGDRKESTARQTTNFTREPVQEEFGENVWSVDRRHAAIDQDLAEHIRTPHTSSHVPAPGTPLPNVSTPRDQSLRWGSIRNVMCGVTPGPTRMTECPDSYRSTMTPSPFEGETEVRPGMGRTPHVTIVREPVAKVTLSGDRQPRHQRSEYASDTNKNMTPVPIVFPHSDEKKTSNPLQSTIDTIPNRTFKDAFEKGDFISDAKTCIRYGVHLSTLKVNSGNGASLRFNAVTGLPQGFSEDADMRLETMKGSSNDFCTALVNLGCDPNLLREKWVTNHLRWIIWKFAAYERRFARHLGGRHLTFGRTIQGLKARYDKETIQGKRPALRKILNRDVAASRTMILAVSHVFPAVSPSSSTPNPGEHNLTTVRIEVTDGWYSVPAVLDTALSGFVRSGVVKIGSKLAVSCARLIGADDGIDPLDDAYDATDPSCNIALLLSANATRLAKWNAKLGFVRNSLPSTPKGLLLTKRISDVLPNGGNVPIIRFVVTRRYPLLYYEKVIRNEEQSGQMSSGRSSVLTELEEDQKRIEHEKRFSKAAEKLYEELEADITKEVDEDAPQAWAQMMSSTSPEEAFESLNHHERSLVSKWKQTRSELIRRRIQQEVQAEMEVDTLLVRDSRPFIRMKVHSLFPSESKNEEALLTIWEPNEEQRSLLVEGAAIQMENLSVKGAKHDGLLQLTATGRTPFGQHYVDQNSHESIGFTKRRFLNLIQVHCTSHKLSMQETTTRHEEGIDFDTVAFLVRVTKSTEGYQLYVADESKLMLRIQCSVLPSGLEMSSGTKSVSRKQKEATKLGQVYSFQDLKLLSYDCFEDCAVAQICDTSSLTKSSTPRVEQLRRRLAEDSSIAAKVSKWLDSKLPLMERPIAFHAVGYIIGLKAVDKGKLHIEVDCGSDLEEWELPVGCIEGMVPTAKENEQTVVLTPEEEIRIAKLGVLGSICRARGLLWQFQLSHAHNPGTPTTERRVVVERAVKADLMKLRHLYA